jgi:glycosyltransferase involved in cell wall biosynthesis
MRVIAMLAVYNEEHYIAACLEHLFRHGIEAYLIGNESTDRSAVIARHYLGRGMLRLPSQRELREYISDERLDASNPWQAHYLSRLVT